MSAFQVQDGDIVELTAAGVEEIQKHKNRWYGDWTIYNKGDC